MTTWIIENMMNRIR